MKYRLILILAATCGWGVLSAQHYTAVNGSAYFGSLNVYNNPASIVNSPYKWDLTLFGTQYTTITNTLRGHNFPFYLSPSARFTVASGNYARQADFNYNIRLLNARYSINRNQALAFGINFKGYAQGSTSQVNYNDSVKGPLSFLSINEQDKVLRMRMAGSSWLEFYGSYGLTLMNSAAGKLTGGATVRVLRGMAGAFADVENVGVARTTENDHIAYKIVNGNARYGYSDNFGQGGSFRASDLFSGSRAGVAVDLGVEYVVKTQAVTNVYNREGAENDYEWKIGFALLDIGSNHYRYGSQSRHISSLKENTTSSVLQEKFVSIKNFERFNDSLATIVNDARQLTGVFSISNPARAVISVDRCVRGNFYVNGELSLNLLSAAGSQAVVKESNLLTVTPRWEGKKFGVYLPAQFTQHGNFWIGAALRAGPVLLGTHNLLNMFSTQGYLSGGGYIALILRPSGLIKDPRDRRLDCPSID